MKFFGIKITFAYWERLAERRVQRRLRNKSVQRIGEAALEVWADDAMIAPGVTEAILDHCEMMKRFKEINRERDE